MRRFLDGFATFMMIAASCALVYVAVTLRQSNAVASASPTYEVGDAFGELKGVRFGESPKTLVMFVRSGCKYCTESGPFYARLLGLSQRIPIVAVGFEEVSTIGDYLTSLNVKPDIVVKGIPGLVRLNATPTLVLVSAKGKVERVWRGRLSAESEQSVIQSVAR